MAYKKIKHANIMCISIAGFFLVIVSIFHINADCQLVIARLKYGGGGDWYADPSSLPNLVKAVKKRTDIPICDSIVVVELMDEGLFRYPFLFMTGHGNVKFTLQERLRLRKYLTGGGFLWADDCFGMDTSFRREIDAVFPENPLVEISLNHPVYKSRYNMPALPKIHEHDGEPAQGLGIFYGKRLVVFYSFDTDIGDGMEDPDVHKDSDALREQAMRMGINIVSWFFSPFEEDLPSVRPTPKKINPIRNNLLKSRIFNPQD
jgi:hypothetical protein